MKEGNKLEFIYWFAFYNLNSASVRYRAKYPLDFLKKNHNINSYLVIPSYTTKGIYTFLKAYFSAILYRKPNSLIVIQRVQSHFVYACLLKLLVLVRKHNTIYDLDDADYLEVNPSTIYFFSKKCEIISAGSRKIAEHLKQYNECIIHTTSPTVDLGITKISKNSPFNIGWIGDFKGDHKESLIQFVFPALRCLSFNFKFTIVGIEQVEDLKFIHSYFADRQNVEIDVPMQIDWNNETYLQNLIVNFDIGIATLLNNEMQISKSGIKAKQYLNNGIPVLSTNLPENDLVIQHGYNGFFCSDAMEFEERMNQFYNMPESEYLVYSKNARSSNKNFNLQKFCSKLEKMKTLLLLAGIFLPITYSSAQSATLTSGGEASGSSGTISYSIGQTNYLSFSSGSGKISDGVQQPIEILTINVEELPLTFSASIFPNPTSDQLIVQISTQKNQNLFSLLFDVQGNLLLREPIIGNTHKIFISDLSSGIYILKISNGKESITSKIIKSE